MGAHCSSLMLGSAVSSSTPNDFHPTSHKGVVSTPRRNRQAWAAPPGMAYIPVGMTRALDSAIGLPRDSTSALRMLSLLMPAEVSRNFMMPLLECLLIRLLPPGEEACLFELNVRTGGESGPCSLPWRRRRPCWARL